MQLIRDLESTRDETLTYFSLDQRDLTRTYAPGKWSVRFILHHLADSETVLFDRVRRILSESRQVLWVFDQDAWAKGLDYSQLPLDISRRVYEAVRNAGSPDDTLLQFARSTYDAAATLGNWDRAAFTEVKPDLHSRPSRP